MKNLDEYVFVKDKSVFFYYWIKVKYFCILLFYFLKVLELGYNYLLFNSCYVICLFKSNYYIIFTC